MHPTNFLSITGGGGGVHVEVEGAICRSGILDQFHLKPRVFLSFKFKTVMLHIHDMSMSFRTVSEMESQSRVGLCQVKSHLYYLC